MVGVSITARGTRVFKTARGASLYPASCSCCHGVTNGALNDSCHSFVNTITDCLSYTAAAFPFWMMASKAPFLNLHGNRWSSDYLFFIVNGSYLHTKTTTKKLRCNLLHRTCETNRIIKVNDVKKKNYSGTFYVERVEQIISLCNLLRRTSGTNRITVQLTT